MTPQYGPRQLGGRLGHAVVRMLVAGTGAQDLSDHANHLFCRRRLSLGDGFLPCARNGAPFGLDAMPLLLRQHRFGRFAFAAQAQVIRDVQGGDHAASVSSSANGHSSSQPSRVTTKPMVSNSALNLAMLLPK